MTVRPMSLDNRPTKISVKDIPESANDSELRQHFQVPIFQMISYSALLTCI